MININPADLAARIQSLTTARFHDAIVDKVTSRIVIIAAALGIMFYLITIGFNYIKTGVGKISGKESGYFIDFDDLMRTLGILTLICLYFPIMTVTTQVCDFAFEMTQIDNGSFNKLEKEFKTMQNGLREISQETDRVKYEMIIKQFESNKKDATAINQQQYEFAKLKLAEIKNGKSNSAQTDNNAVQPVQEESFSWSRFDPVRWLFEKVFNGLVWMISGIAKQLVFAIAKVFLKILYCVGPLALAFSILPMFRRQGEIWFSKFICTYFVFVTFNILDYLFSSVAGSNLSGDAAAQYHEYSVSLLTYNIVILLAYFSAFKITSWYVGSSDVGRVVSKGVQVASDAARLILMAKTGGLSKGANTVSNVANEAQKTAGKGEGGGSVFKK